MNSIRGIEDLAGLAWPPAQLGEALECLARRSGLPVNHDATVPTVTGAEDAAVLANWMDAAASSLGLEAEEVDCSYAEAEALLRHCGPALVQARIGEGAGFLAVLEGSDGSLELLSPALQSHRVELKLIRAAICQAIEQPLTSQSDVLLHGSGVPAGRRPFARAALLRQQLSGTRIGGCWLIRLPPNASPGRQAREARVGGPLVGLLAAHAAQYLLWLLSWWVIGQAAFEGRFDWGWLAAWALVLLSMMPFQLLVTWWQGLLSLRLGALLKRRLLFGALQLRSEEVRRQGCGQLLGRVIESEAVESLALTGGFLALVSALELVLAATVIVLGPAGWQQVAILVAWTGLAIGLGWCYVVRRAWWTESRLHATNELVENMVGHRTRLAQQAPERWHEREDQAVCGFLSLAQDMDRCALWLTSVTPRGWLVLGLAGFTPSFAAATATPAQLGIGLGGMLLAFRALQRLTGGMAQLAGAMIAWRQVAPIFRAGSRATDGGAFFLAPAKASGSGEGREDRTLLEAQGLSFGYRDRGLPVLRDCSLKIHNGDRLLLEGPSGGGKSTLASLLAGLRPPDSGLLLLHGLDGQTLGLRGWRRRVAAAPQFHENHVLTGTFAFNLLMGRRWPPTMDDFAQAESICRELGLEQVLGRMPAGLLQLVGEGGWQLSHGEKSRLYIARALLQGAELVILDESFAALDPETLQLAMQCVLRRAPALLVVAHP